MKNLISFFLFLSILFLSNLSSAQTKTLVIVGDSLTEGYGVAREASYPFLMEKKIKQEKKDWKVVNSGIGGSTSASVEGRVKWVLKTKPDLVVLFLGGNDALRGLPPTTMEQNFEKALALLKESKTKTVLVEMWAPPNYGDKYTKDFKNVFVSLKKKHDVTLVTFPLGGIAGQKNLNQADGIHPNEKGHEFLADEVYKKINQLL